ncbi:hypothetical protein CGRA01v4_05295 [Colletotrichum graminicola]|nr:hypothetical protein CGRA01v4_05295 [Colletotrichum graminicola]
MTPSKRLCNEIIQRQLDSAGLLLTAVSATPASTGEARSMELSRGQPGRTHADRIAIWKSGSHSREAVMMVSSITP